jgi:valyl-tRNA synthetase
LGDTFVEIVAAARKVKSDLAVSLRAPVTTLTISPGNGEFSLEKIKRLLGDTSEDLRLTLNAAAVAWAEAVPQDTPTALSPGERFRISLEMARTGEVVEG